MNVGVEDLDSNGCALTLVIFTYKMVDISNRISLLTECAVCSSSQRLTEESICRERCVRSGKTGSHARAAVQVLCPILTPARLLPP